MVGRSRSPQAILGSSATPLRLLGLWFPQEEDTSRTASVLTGGVSLAVICGATIISILKLLMDPPGELEELVACIFVVTMHSEIFLKILQTVEGRTKAVKLILALPPLLYDVGIYCTFGQIVTDQSEKLMHSVYSCGWVDCNARFRRSILTFTLGCRRPLDITVGGIYKLSKETFLQVLHGSYAMFNMLYGFQSNK